MVSKANFTRIDITELKALIYQKLGNKRAEIYFHLLNRLSSAKVSKSDFDRLCIRTVGREHLSLHNLFIRSILKNASCAKVPPPKVIKANDPLNIKITTGYQKKRSPVNRDRRNRDRPSPLGPLGKTRSPTLDHSPTELNSLGSKPRMEDGEEVEQITGTPCLKRRSPITAPLDVSRNFGGSSRAKTLFRDSGNDPPSITCQSSGELPDTMSLRGQLEHRLLSKGVGISADCVKLLNNSLDMYLKRLIEPGLGLARLRFGVRGTLSGSCLQRPATSICMSMLDFCLSMESNPRVLGGDWPVQLEKVCSRADKE